LHATLFRAALAPFVQPLVAEQTKWLLAKPYCLRQPCLTLDNPDAFSEYVRRALGELMPPMVPLNEPA
jgi:hypothetical protein